MEKYKSYFFLLIYFMPYKEIIFLNSVTKRKVCSRNAQADRQKLKTTNGSRKV